MHDAQDFAREEMRGIIAALAKVYGVEPLTEEEMGFTITVAMRLQELHEMANDGDEWARDVIARINGYIAQELKRRLN